VSVWGAIAGAFVGTIVMTTALRAANEFQLTRMDIPFLLGTAFTDDRTKAKALGYGLHFCAGQIFALIYYAIFLTIGASGWWLGGLFGAVHGLFASTALVNILLPLVHPRMGSRGSGADSVALLEAPGFLMLNYGPRTPIANLVAHIAYGAIVGGFISLASG